MRSGAFPSTRMGKLAFPPKNRVRGRTCIIYRGDRRGNSTRRIAANFPGEKIKFSSGGSAFRLEGKRLPAARRQWPPGDSQVINYRQFAGDRQNKSYRLHIDGNKAFCDSPKTTPSPSFRSSLRAFFLR